ncbi:MAG: adenylyltransferase/cytidyltransferase family protein [Candidatus Moraniibacteriota bacterium]|nr:MAG: adenylyltransferase/cytidyltransferase family protein [Candidatus Moranbacteria bacterium]
MQYFQDKIAHSLNDLAKKRQAIVRNNNEEKIVLTSGCFDILHGGHLEYLCDANKYGFLIVGVNSDAFVRRLKGSSRPLRGQEDRLFTIAGFEPVELAVIFNDDVELIRTVQPDIYVASNTSHIRIWDDTYRLQTLQNMGTAIIELTAHKEESTTNIIARAQSAFA